MVKPDTVRQQNRLDSPRTATALLGFGLSTVLIVQLFSPGVLAGSASILCREQARQRGQMLQN